MEARAEPKPMAVVVLPTPPLRLRTTAEWPHDPPSGITEFGDEVGVFGDRRGDVETICS
jgi:hypothetical protein